MRVEYQKTLQIVRKRLEGLLYHIAEDSSHLAVLDNGTCWKICVEGERYSDSTILLLRYLPVGSDASEEFAVWILMEAFEGIFGSPHVVPRLDAQLDFLYKHLSNGFPDPAVFRVAYEQLNQPD